MSSITQRDIWESARVSIFLLSGQYHARTHVAYGQAFVPFLGLEKRVSGYWILRFCAGTHLLLFSVSNVAAADGKDIRCHSCFQPPYWKL